MNSSEFNHLQSGRPCTRWKSQVRFLPRPLFLSPLPPGPLAIVESTAQCHWVLHLVDAKAPKLIADAEMLAFLPSPIAVYEATTHLLPDPSCWQPAISGDLLLIARVGDLVCVSFRQPSLHFGTTIPLTIGKITSDRFCAP